jgi:hypothetical protein
MKKSNAIAMTKNLREQELLANLDQLPNRRQPGYYVLLVNW